MSKGKLSTRGARIVEALDRFADDLEAGAPMTSRYTVRTMRVIPEPSPYPPARVRAVRELIGARQEVFAQLLAVSPMTIRSWEQGLRQPSPIARRFLDEIEMAPGHFRGRILAAAVDTGRGVVGVSAQGRTPATRRFLEAPSPGLVFRDESSRSAFAQRKGRMPLANSA